MKRSSTARSNSSSRHPFGLEKLEGRQLFAEVPAGFVDTRVASNLSTPTSLEAAPDGRMFVSEQDGTIFIVKNGQLLSTPFAELDVNSEVERGLLGIALDPNFASNGYVYAYYTSADEVSRNRIVRLTANGDVATGGETLIFELPDEAAKWHNGGAMEFGPDGKLYVAVGDHQSGSSAQRMTTLRGKILRINPDGSIPTDNPFYNTATEQNRAIWALGLRNPYTMAFQPGTGRLYANDVGDQTWEELNEITRGGNYGWSAAEGDVNNPEFIDPLYVWEHNVSGGGESIIGGAFYTGVAQQFPEEYKDKYFVADFARSWLRTYDPATGQVANFAKDLKNPTGLTVTPDGTIWYLSRNIGAGATGGAVGSLRKITYSASGEQAPTITDQPEDQLAAAGSTATFTVGASGSGTLAFQWNRNGTPISGANSATYSLTAAQADDGAVYTVTVTNAFGTITSEGATLDVAAGTPPVPTILTPAADSTYAGGQVFNFSGSGIDPEDGTLAADAFTWRVDFHHDTHSHPFIGDTEGVTSGSFTIPDNNETSTNVWYRVYLTTTDSSGLSATTFRDIQPRTTNVAIQTVPAGLSINVDGTPKAHGTVLPGVEGVKREVSAPATQTLNGVTYTFAGWSDGGAETHLFPFPVDDGPLVATYTANSQTPTPTPPPTGPAARPVLQATLPAAAISGARLKGAKASVVVRNDGTAPLNGPVTVRLFASTDDKVDAGDAAVGSPVTKRMRLAQGANGLVKMKVNALPALADGSYKLIAQTVAGQGVAVGDDASDGSITVAAPFVDLSGGFSSLSPTTIGGGRRAVVPITISNAGNAPAGGMINVLLAAGASQNASAGDLVLGTIPVKLKLPENGTRVYKLRVTVPTAVTTGAYFLHATIDSTGVISESNESNNTASSTSAVFIQNG